MSIDSRPAEYVSTRLARPLSTGLSSKRKQVGERVRVRGPSVELILGRESHQTNSTVMDWDGKIQCQVKEGQPHFPMGPTS